jgi:ABC-type transport system substrate-binding protein
MTSRCSKPTSGTGGAPRIKTIVIKPIPETTARVYALLNGEVDLAAGIALQPGAGDRGEQQGSGPQGSEPRGDVLRPYGTVGPTANKKVRQAINYGVNVDAILKGVMEGDGERARASWPRRRLASIRPSNPIRMIRSEPGSFYVRPTTRPTTTSSSTSGRTLPERQDDRRGHRCRSQEDRHQGLVKSHEWGNYVSATTGQNALDAAAGLGPRHAGCR